MAGVALMALGWLWWRAWVPVDAVDAAAFCVAGVALGDMDRHFAWQAWHLWHWAGSGGALGSQLTHNLSTHNLLNFVTYNSFTHNTFTYTNLHTQHCRTQLFHPTCLAPSPCLPAFPISFSLEEVDLWSYPVL